MPSVIAIIPAKARSTGIERKNARLLAGWPLTAWSIIAAQKAKIDRVVVTTDDDEIGDLAYTHGAEIVWRPPGLCSDTVGDQSVAVHALKAIGAHDNAVVVWLRPTAPFRRPDEIDAVVNMLRDHPELSSVRSVVPGQTPQKLYAGASFSGLDYDVLLPYLPAFHAANEPRQGLGKVFRPCGFVDVVRAQWPYLGSMEGPIIARWDAPVDRALDLDSESDWLAAEALAVRHNWTPGRCE